MLDTSRMAKESVAELERAGWYAGRAVPLSLLPDDYLLFPRAREALTELYGLRVGRSGRGIDCATSDIWFEPEYGAGVLEENEHTTHDSQLLYPLAAVSHRHALWFISERGHVYFYYDRMSFYSDSVERAIEMAVLGLRPKGA